MNSVTRSAVFRAYGPFLLLVMWLIAIKLVILGGSPAFRSPAQAAVFAWPFLGIVLVAGLGGVWMSRRVAIPDLLDPRVGNRHRFLAPLVIGLVLGLTMLGSDWWFGWSHPLATGHGQASIHIPYPASLLIYPGGAIIVCVIYYLVPIPLLTWVLARTLWGGRHHERAFWIAGLLCAAIEPLTQDLTPSMRMLRGVGVLVFSLDYVANAAQVVVYRKAGFLAVVTLRVAFYLVWHVAPSLGMAP